MFEKENEELMQALRHGDMETLRKIKPEVVRQDAGRYAYGRALNAETVYFLIKCGVPPVLGDKGETPLFHCRADKVESLIAAGYDVNHHAPDVFGGRALIAATYANDMEKVLTLLACGADVTLANQYGRKALFFAKTEQMRYVLRVAEMKQKIQRSMQNHQTFVENGPTKRVRQSMPYKLTSWKCPLKERVSYQNAG